jgi:hypothetical protein
MVTKAEIDGIYDMDKVIDENWQWQRRGPNFEGEATVYCLHEDVNLTLKGWKRRNYGFCLLYKSSKVVRRWDTSVPHTNPDGEVITDPHKYYWTEDHEDAFAYPVDDVTTDDVHQAFWDFLDECNIDLRGTYQTGLQNHD